MSHTPDALAGDALAFALGATLMGYPDALFGARVTGLLATPELARWRDALQPIIRCTETAAGLDDLRSEYIERFDRSALSSLYEGEYGRARYVNKTNILADLAGFYQAFGFELQDGDGHETPDHVAVEMEFYSLLLMKQAALFAHGDTEGVEIVGDARRKFMAEHLGCLVRGLALRPEVAASEPYRPTVAWCLDLVEAQCLALGVDPEAALAAGAAANAESEAEPDHSKCGDCALTQLQ